MDGLSDSDFKDYYENKHAPLAASLLSLEGYERNYINSKINPLLPSLGSISIFKYQSIESLNVIGKQMESEAGDTLRDDEIKFMDISKNYFFLTQSDQLTEQEFNKKIFYSANNEDSLSLLDSYEGIRKISNNILLEPLVLTLIQQEVDKVNENLPPWEQIKKYEFLPEPLSIERGELTPKMSVKRQIITNNYAELIEKIYSE